MQAIQSKRTVWCYLIFVVCTNFATMLSFLTIYLQHLRFSLAAISAFLLAYQLCKFIFEIPTGFLSDKYGRKVVGQIGLVGMILYYALLLLRPNTILMVVALAMRGISESCISGSLESLFIDSLPKEGLARYNALERFCFYMANGVSALLGGVLIGAQLFQLSIAVDIVAAIFAFLSSTGIRSSSEPVHCNAQSNTLSLINAASMLKSNSMLMGFLAMDFAQAFCFVGLEEFYTLVLQDNGIDALWSGGIIAVQLIATSLFGFLVPALLKGRNKAPMLYRLAITRLVVTALLLVPGDSFPIHPCPLLPRGSPFHLICADKIRAVSIFVPLGIPRNGHFHAKPVDLPWSNSILFPKQYFLECARCTAGSSSRSGIVVRSVHSRAPVCHFE